jgi:hypothetical protein
LLLFAWASPPPSPHETDDGEEWGINDFPEKEQIYERVVYPQAEQIMGEPAVQDGRGESIVRLDLYG